LSSFSVVSSLQEVFAFAERVWLLSKVFLDWVVEDWSGVGSVLIRYHFTQTWGLLQLHLFYYLPPRGQKLFFLLIGWAIQAGARHGSSGLVFFITIFTFGKHPIGNSDESQRKKRQGNDRTEMKLEKSF